MPGQQSTHRLGIRDVLTLDWPDHARNRRGGLGTHALVLAVFADHADGYGIAFPKMSTVADMLGVAPQTVERACGALDDWEMIDRVRLRHPTSGNYAGYLTRVNAYPPVPDREHLRTPSTLDVAGNIPDSWFDHPSSATGSHPSPATGSHPSPATGSHPSPATGHEATTKEATTEEVITHVSLPNDSDTPDNFRLTLDVQDTDTLTRQLDSLRDTYPRRQNRNGGRCWGGGSRQETEEQFRRLDDAERRQVVAAAEHYAVECEQTDTYPKHCHRWIQKGLWREYLDGPTVGTLGRDDSRLVL